jgi:hypothetical protein
LAEERLLLQEEELAALKEQASQMEEMIIDLQISLASLTKTLQQETDIHKKLLETMNIIEKESTPKR